MTLHDIIKFKFPLAQSLVDFTVCDHNDGRGPVLGEWNISASMPTPEQLAQWAIELQPQFGAEQEVVRIAELNKDTMAKLLEIDMKSIRRLREGNNTEIAKLELQAAVLRGKLIV